MMDFSSFYHAIASVALQCAVGLLFGMWGVGGAIGCMWFIAREHTQAEYRWIAMFGNGKRANMPWWGGFLLQAHSSGDATFAQHPTRRRNPMSGEPFINSSISKPE